VDSSGGSFEINPIKVAFRYYLDFEVFMFAIYVILDMLRKKLKRCRYAVQIKPNKKCLINLNQKLDSINKSFL